MFRNVLVGVDGSPNGRDAVALATLLASPGGSLTLAHVYVGGSHVLHRVEPGVIDEERARSQQLLEQESSHAGVAAKLVSLAASSPGAGLHRQAEEQGADLLVVGSCSRGAFGRAVLGDDTRGALNGAPCAVAVAARGYAQAGSAIARVGVAYNGSDESIAALDAARSIAAERGASVHAMHVVAIPTYAYTGLMAPNLGDGLDTILEQANESIGELDGVEGRAVYGLSGEELAAFGDEVDLLIVGSRGYGPLKRLVLGSTSDYLQRHARCSLLVLPRAAVAATAS